jgi:hypothetical protein
VLAITRGFGDALVSGHQERTDIFARDLTRPRALFARVVEIDERIAADAQVMTPLDRSAAYNLRPHMFNTHPGRERMSEVGKRKTGCEWPHVGLAGREADGWLATDFRRSCLRHDVARP